MLRRGDHRYAALAAPAVFLVLLALQPGAGADLAFGSDTLITSNSNAQENPWLAVSNDSIIYVIWQDERNSVGSPDIYIARSTDNGSSFSSPVRVDDSTTGSQAYPRLVLDSSGKLHAIWQDTRSGSARIYYANSTDNGTSWSASVLVNQTSTGQQYVPSLAVDSSGNIHVAWEDTRTAGAHIYYARSTDGGASFGAAKKIDSSSGTARYPCVCVSSGSKVTVAWEDTRNTKADIFLATSADSGASFGAEVNATRDTLSSSQTRVRAAWDAGGSLHLVWQDDRNGNLDIYYGLSSDGSSFTAVPVNDTGAGTTDQEGPGIYVDGSNKAHIVWKDKRSGSGYNIYYAVSNGTDAFTTNVRVDNATSSASCSDPCVATDANGIPGVVWEDNRNLNLDIFYDRSLNAPPLAPELVSPADGVWVTTGSPNFTWSFRDVNENDTQSAFQLQTSSSSLFTTLTYDSGAVASAEPSHTPASAIQDGVHYWRVRTRDQGGVWGPYAGPRVVKIDTVAPSASTPQDDGVWATSSTLNWSWAPSSDATSGLAGYYISVGTAQGLSDVVSEVWTTEPRYSLSGGTNGTTYYARVRAVDNATNKGPWSADSDGVTVDVTVPTAGTPCDEGVYINSSLVRFSWTASEDYPSGIAGYYVCIGSGAGLDDIVRDAFTSSASYTYAGGLNGVTYYAKVKARDNAGNVGGYGPSSDGVTVDTSIPQSYTPQDNGTYSNTTTLYWRWPPSWDSPSGIKGYYVSVGTTYGGNETVADLFTTSTSFTLDGAEEGRTYYCRICAADNAGNLGPPSASSDGITVDTTPPSDFQVLDEGEYSRSGSALRASWSSSLDEVSGVVEYRYAIGTSQGGEDVVPWTSAGVGISVTRVNLSLSNGVTYYFSVRARNGAGLWSNVSASDGITVDTSYPVASKPSAGGVYCISSSVTWSWEASTDSPSGVLGYYISIGTQPGASDVVRDGFTPEPYFTLSSAQNGRTYYSRVRAADRAGNVGDFGPISDPVTVDISVPQAPSPTDGGRYSTSSTVVFNWSAAEDSPSGIAGYYLCIGTSPGGSDVLLDYWTDSLSYTLTGAESGRSYYAKLRAVDRAGNAGPYGASSDGILVDLTPPPPVVVYGGGYLRNTTELQISWSVSLDLESPVAEYLCALGTSPGASDIVPWTSAGLRVSTALTGLSLRNGGSYWASVRARNAAGLASDAASSDSIVVDIAPPFAGTPEAPGAFVNRSTVTWVWPESMDGESGVAGYYVSIGSSEGASDVVDGAWSPNSTFTYLGGVNGATYFATVRAVDRAGNIGPPASSDAGVTVDTSIPSVLPALAASAYSASASIEWSWTPSTDHPSGVVGYYVSVGLSPGGEDVVREQWTPASSFKLATGEDGRSYFIKVRARDAAGNEGSYVLGAGVTVDLTPPEGSVSIEGGSLSTARRAVMLALEGSEDVVEMMVSSSPDLEGAHWEPFARSRSWSLEAGDGAKSVYVRLRDRAGHESALLSASIALDTSVSPFKIETSVGAETRAASTTVSSRVEPGSRAFVNGREVVVSPDGSFSASVQLQEGSNVIVVSVVDPAGNTQTLTKSIWRAPTLGLGAGAESGITMALALVAIALVLVVLYVSLRTQRMLRAHIERGHAAPTGGAEERDKRERRVSGKERGPGGRGEEGTGLRDETERGGAGAGVEGAGEGFVERPAPVLPERRGPGVEVIRGPLEELQREAPAAPLEGGEAETQVPAGAAYAESGAEVPTPALHEAGVKPSYAAVSGGDVVIRADGSEVAAPEPTLVSEWSPETGQWVPVSESATPSEAEAPIEGAAPTEPTSVLGGEERPHPLDEFARTAPPREERPLEVTAPLPAPAGTGQRLSARQIYEALYGKRPGAPQPQTPAGAPAPAQPEAPPAQPPAEKRMIGRSRCPRCKSTIPVYSLERPLTIECPSCGLKGVIK
ncbi:MAG: fibronectin type III domain-containing protein [Thermoplasmatota archaeon]